MKFQYYWGKFRWWLRDHLYFYPNLLGNEVEMKYALPEGYDNFAVHPCVRYIQEGIGGNKWWMVLTPYKNYDITQENILLFRGVDGTDNSSPTEWSFVKEVCGKHPKGYNSDPNLFYDGHKLWVVWREWETENLPKDCPICCIRYTYTSDGVSFSEIKTIAENQFDKVSDSTMCPIVFQKGNDIFMYASAYKYEPILTPLGTSRYRWNGNSFEFEGVSHNPKIKFDLWHFDLFEYKNVLFQNLTGQFGNAILLGKSDDGLHFNYSKRPLLCNPFFLKKNFYYKSSVVILGDKMYVFFPKKLNGGVLRIVRREMPASLLETKFKSNI